MENELRPESNHFRCFFRLRSLVYSGALAHWCAVPGRFFGALVLSTVAAQPNTRKPRRLTQAIRKIGQCLGVVGSCCRSHFCGWPVIRTCATHVPHTCHTRVACVWHACGMRVARVASYLPHAGKTIAAQSGTTSWLPTSSRTVYGQRVCLTAAFHTWPKALTPSLLKRVGVGPVLRAWFLEWLQIPLWCWRRTSFWAVAEQAPHKSEGA